MPKGESGRVVIEMDPALKRQLYSALAIEGSTLKDWFVNAANAYIIDHELPHAKEIEQTKKLSKRL